MINSEVKVTNMDLSPENGVAPTEKRFSKINGKVCKLKMKVFSTDGTAKEVQFSSEADLNPVQSIELDERSFNETKSEEISEKKYSVTALRERLREAKFSPRQKFRRMCLDNKKFYASVKSKISDNDFKLLKGLLASDVMNILNTVTPEIIKGKQINTLLGLSALSKSLRLAGQKLSMPMRMGLREEKNIGAVSKKRYQDLSAAYNDFIRAVFEYCYGDNNQIVGATDMADAADSLDDSRALDDVNA